MKLHLFAAAAAALLCAAPIVSADADALEVNNFDFEEQLDLDNFISESEEFWGKSLKGRGFFGRRSFKDRDYFGKSDKGRDFESYFCMECRAEARQASRSGRRSGKASVSRAFQSRAVQDECLLECGIDLRRTIRRAERRARRNDRRNDRRDDGKSGKFEELSKDTEFASAGKATKEPRSVREGKAAKSDGSLPRKARKEAKGSKTAAVPAVFASE